MNSKECKFIPDIYHTFTDDDYLYLVLEYINSNSLNEKIQCLQDGKGFPTEAVQYLSAQIILSLEYL